MTELAQFRPGLVRRQLASFRFERASVSLLDRFKHQRTLPLPLALNSEWRDPIALTASMERRHA